MFRAFHVLILIALVSGAQTLASEIHTVFPTGNFQDDLNNIQSKIDDASARGVDLRLVLKATNIYGVPTAFNFGSGAIIAPPGNGGTRWGVRILGDGGETNIVGEKSNGMSTTIQGGYVPIVHNRREYFSIKNIHFHRPERIAISVLGAQSGRIKRNAITDIEPDTLPGPYSNRAFGISVSSSNVNGTIRVIDNSVQGTMGSPSGGQALSFGGVNSDFDLVIRGNSVFNYPRDPIFFEAYGGHAIIKNNLLDAGPATPFESLTGWGTGIHVFTCLGPATFEIRDNDIYVPDFSLGGIRFLVQPCTGFANLPLENSVVEDNRIFAADASGIQVANADGIFRDNVIRDNEIEIVARDWGFAAVDLLEASIKEESGGRIDNNLIKGNEVMGFAPVGISLEGGFGDLPGGDRGLIGNTIEDNDFDDFVPMGLDLSGIPPADIFLGASFGAFACGNSVEDQEDDLVVDQAGCNFIEIGKDDDDDSDDDDSDDD